MSNDKLTISSSEKISLISNLATMLSAGIPILEAVDSLREETKGNPHRILQVLREDLVQGNRVYSSFSKFPRVFDKVTTSIIRASEEAGTLDITLKDLKSNVQKEIEFSDKIKGSLIYPAFISLVFLGVLMVILISVVPKIAQVFSRLNTPLPWPTRVLIFVSNLLTQHPVEVTGILLTSVALVIFIYRQKSGFFVNLLFSLPFISHLINEIDLTRFARSLYLLLYSGLPITTALELTTDVVIKRETAKAIAISRERVLAGKTLSDGFRETKGFVPPIVIKLIEAGEKTGSLDRSMQDISEYFDYQVTNTLKMLTSLLEPVMLVLVGIVIGGMMLAIISPMYSLIGQVKVR